AGASAASAPAGEAFEPRFSAREAQRVGLIEEASVDWSSPNPIPAAQKGAAPASGTSLRGSEAPVELDLDLATRPAPIDDLPVARAHPVAPTDPEPFPSIEPPPTAVVPPPTPAPHEAVAEPDEPTEGSQLRHHLQIGASYQLRLKEQWGKVRLSHMNT